MLTSGRVTPVTGKRLTLTAILLSACMTRVKLRPSARNAPSATSGIGYHTAIGLARAFTLAN